MNDTVPAPPRLPYAGGRCTSNARAAGGWAQAAVLATKTTDTGHLHRARGRRRRPVPPTGK